MPGNEQFPACQPYAHVSTGDVASDRLLSLRTVAFGRDSITILPSTM